MNRYTVCVPTGLSLVFLRGDGLKSCHTGIDGPFFNFIGKVSLFTLDVLFSFVNLENYE